MEKDNVMSDESKAYLIKRLNIIGGQLKGVVKIIDSNRSYEEIIIQIGALTNSLKGVGQKIVEEYIKNNFKSDSDKTIKDLLDLWKKLV